MKNCRFDFQHLSAPFSTTTVKFTNEQKGIKKRSTNVRQMFSTITVYYTEYYTGYLTELFKKKYTRV